MGWRKREVAETILFVTIRYRQEMGQRVARARDARGMTNESLARASGLSVKTVSRFVNGRHEPREHTIKSLAKGLGITPEEIRGTPPAPLGLGAREDQVEEGFSEFREYVAQILERLDEAHTERVDMQAVVDQHKRLLEEQSKTLAELTEFVGQLPELREIAQTVKDLRDADAADRTERQAQPAAELRRRAEGNDARRETG